MTRETKIGLLIGLGFIVVFAVLLSHTGTSGTAGDRLVVGTRSPVAQSTSGGSTPTNPGYVPTGTVRPAARAAAEPATRPSNRIGLSEPTALPRRPREVETGADQLAKLPLPEPKGLDNRATAPTVADNKPMTSWENLLRAKKFEEGSVHTVTAVPAPANLPQGRVAPARSETASMAQTAPPVVPAVVPPQPGVRPAVPAVDSPATLAIAAKASPPDRREAPKEYVVQKGDTLRKIVKDSYGVSSTKVVEFLVASNKGTIKNKNWIVEGQKLVVPPLPPEMFEGVGNIDVSAAGPAIRTVTNEELKKVLSSPPGGQRTAPEPAKPDLAARPVDPTLSVVKPATPAPATAAAAERPDKPEKPAVIAAKPDKPQRASGHRYYAVRAGDTLRSISARELGSPNAWPEIIKLNPQLDPKRLKVGTKIKVPESKPLVEGGWARRVSA